MVYSRKKDILEASVILEIIYKHLIIGLEI